MSARATDDVGNLVRRLSRLLNHKTAGSLGAVAGFAIAVVFAWKFLRSPPGIPRTNALKRRITPSTSQPAGGFGSSSEGLAPVLEMKVSDAVEAISAPIQLSPGQIVKKKLSGGPNSRRAAAGGCRTFACFVPGIELRAVSIMRGASWERRLFFSRVVIVSIHRQARKTGVHSLVRDIWYLAGGCSFFIAMHRKANRTTDWMASYVADHAGGLF